MTDERKVEVKVEDTPEKPEPEKWFPSEPKPEKVEVDVNVEADEPEKDEEDDK